MSFTLIETVHFESGKETTLYEPGFKNRQEAIDLIKAYVPLSRQHMLDLLNDGLTYVGDRKIEIKKEIP